MASSTTASERYERVPVDALVQLSRRLVSQVDRLRLAAKLGFNSSEILRYKRSNDAGEDIALDILLKWHTINSGTRERTRSVLERALADIDRNDLCHMFKEIIKESCVRISPNLEQMKTEETRPVSHSRLVVCGSGRAGKTCLLRTFLNMLFEDTESTRGVDFSRVMCFGTRGEGSTDWTWKICENTEELDLRCEAHARAQEAGKESMYSKQTEDQAERHNKASKTLHPDVAEYEAAVTAGLDYGAKLRKWLDSATEKDMHFLDIWDLAGQSSYIAFQQVVIKEGDRCAYAIVYNCSTVLDTPEELAVIERWLDFLCDTTGEKDFFFYLVGCQIDKIQPELHDVHKDKVKQKIRNKFPHKPYAQRLGEDQLFFFVDNTVSGKEGLAPGSDAARLRCRITGDLATTCRQQFIPLRWLSFAFTIGALASMKPCLPLDHALFLAEEVCKTDNERELRDILKFYNQLGRLLYHELTDVKAKVILDVRGFLKVISALFLPCHTEMDNGPWEIAVKRLHTFGILFADLAFFIWRRDCRKYEELFNDGDKQVLIFEVMEKYALLFNTGVQMYLPGSTGTSQAFFVPSLAPPSQQSETPVALSKLLTDRALYLKCGNTFKWHRRFTLPKFWQLVVRVLQRIRPTADVLEVVKLTQTSAILPLQSKPHIIYLAYEKGGVQVSLHWPQEQRGPPSQVCQCTSEIVTQEACRLMLDSQTSNCSTSQEHQDLIICCAKHTECKAKSSRDDLSVVHLRGAACSACGEFALEDIHATAAFWFAAATVDKAETESRPSSMASSPIPDDHQQLIEGRTTASDEREGLQYTSKHQSWSDVAMASSTTASKRFEGVPVEALTELAPKFFDRVECIRLAAKLGFTGPDIIRYSRSGYSTNAIALDILLSWWATKEGTPSVLEQALLDIGRPDLSHFFKKNCGAGATISSSSTTAAASGNMTKTGRGSGCAASGSAMATAASGSMTKTGQERTLTPGMLFNRISKQFSDIDDVCDLADALLDGIEPSGGRAWVIAKKDDGGVLDPKVKARELLDYWCKKSPCAFGGKLYKELHNVLPNVARKFKHDLLS